MCLLCWFSCSAANAHLFRHVVFYIFVCVKLSCCFCLSALCAHEFESESGVCRAKVAPTLHSRSRRCPNPNPNWQFQVGVCWNGKHHCAGTGVFFFCLCCASVYELSGLVFSVYAMYHVSYISIITQSFRCYWWWPGGTNI